MCFWSEAFCKRGVAVIDFEHGERERRTCGDNIPTRGLHRVTVQAHDAANTVVEPVPITKSRAVDSHLICVWF